MLCILKAIFAWVIMSFASINLIALVVRGPSWTAPNDIRRLAEDAPTDRVREVLRRESRRMTIAVIIMTSLGIVLAAAYIDALFYF